MAPSYPTSYEIEHIFCNRIYPDVFNKYMAEPVDVVVVGQEMNIGGHYNSIDSFHKGIYGRCADTCTPGTLRCEVRRVFGGGDSPWAAVESLITAEGKHGKPWHAEFVDLVRFDSEGKIASLKEFLDTGHYHLHVDEHEKKTGVKPHPGKGLPKPGDNAPHSEAVAA